MGSFVPFDLLNSGLEGTNLIEASAGTGKTYTICGLFLRLILEKHLLANQIVVVTFTVAATQELRNRIRGKLREAIEAFSRGESKDTFLNSLVKKCADQKQGLERLKEAVRDFDEVAIFTIHGFCQRILHENAFESGCLFDTKLVTDQEYIKQEIVDDFWRKQFCQAEFELVDYALQEKKYRPENFRDLLGKVSTHPNIRIVPYVRPLEPGFTTNFRNALDVLKKTWPRAKEQVEELLKNPGIDGRGYGSTITKNAEVISKRDENVSRLIKNMDEYVASDGYPLPLFKDFEKLTASKLAASMKQNQEPLNHPVFDTCEALKESTKAFDAHLLFLKSQLLKYAKDQLTARKQRHNVQFFDDLLIHVHTALKKEGGETLAETLRSKYKAALIDEFQDTDPIQYEIFNTIFGTDNSILFLIGDPKQAIYGFRGADIFTYMNAARCVHSRFTLSQNWRSEPELIAAINALFSSASRPFVYEAIPFLPTEAPEIKQRDIFAIDGQAEPPFHIWFKARNLDKKDIPKYTARETITRSVAAEISRLLNLAKEYGSLIGGKPLREGDIAVLVRKNTEALMVQRALSALGVPSVRYSTDSLFESREAMEIERILAAIAEPGNERLIRAALATDALGLSGEDLADLEEDEKGWDAYLSKFLIYHNLWYKHGFLSMFRVFMSGETVRSRLLAFPDGERRITNVLHLSEVLHKQAMERDLHPEGLVKWLAEQGRDSLSPRLEEYQLRLESDENAVKLVTIHKSKGLEYPVVFCPFSWDEPMAKDGDFTFHSEGDVLTLYLEGFPDDPDREHAQACARNESLAEDARLLYVALTRAKKCCYLVWGGFRGAENSALAHLLHQPEPLPADTISRGTGHKGEVLTDEELRKQLENLAYRADGTIVISDMPEDEGSAYSPLEVSKEELTRRRFAGSISNEWRISSFSYLVSGQAHLTELPDRDAIYPLDRESEALTQKNIGAEESVSIFTFPRGAKAGTLLHDILEHLDFTEKDPSLRRELVVRKLKEYGFDLTWQKVIHTMLDRVLSVPLNAGGDSFPLSCISNENRLNELEFYFPLQPISPINLREILEECQEMEILSGFPEHIERLGFSTVRGFMRGYMDMVFQFHERFYLVDWKSNFLGDRVEDYGPDSLTQAMKLNYYVLQYLLYTMALNQYLALRLPGYKYETHFGGVYYIFLRGVNPDFGPEFGIYRDIPLKELVDELCKNLIAQA
jgi:exodeoxyribonuclease V beta subunit